jgi:hypothetical protein
VALAQHGPQEEKDVEMMAARHHKPLNQLVNQHLQGESGDVPWPPICTAAFWHGLLHDELRKTSMCLAHLQA